MRILTLYSSPNFNERTLPVNGIVIHYTEEELDDTLRIFADDKREKRVSSHYVIDRDGTIYATVPDGKRAWHAGAGSWKGITDLNSASIGIELVYKPGEEYHKDQIDSLIDLCHAIKSRHDIKWVIGHSDFAFARGKVDPGPCFPWKQLAQAGIGIWPDGLRHKSSLSNSELLESIGYDISDEEMAIKAFSLHFCPETGDMRSIRNCLEGVYAATKANESILVSPRQRAWFRLKYDQKFAEGTKNGKSEREIKKGLRNAVPITSVDYHNVFLSMSNANKNRGRRVLRCILEKNLAWLGVTYDDFLEADISVKQEAVDSVKNVKRGEVRDFFSLASESLGEAMFNGEIERINKTLHLIDSVIFTQQHFTSEQIKKLIFSIGEVLHMCRDRPIPPISASNVGYGYGWYRLWLWMKRIVSILRKDISHGKDQQDNGYMPGLFIPWCELICVKMLRHKLFMMNAPYPLPTISSELRTTIRHSFLLCLCDGAEHYLSLHIDDNRDVKHMLSVLNIIRLNIPEYKEPDCRANALHIIEMIERIFVLDDLKSLKHISGSKKTLCTCLLRARIMLSLVMENWGRYLCYSSDKGDKELLESLIKCAKVSAWVRDVSVKSVEEVGPTTVSTLVSALPLEYDFVVRWISVVSDIVFLEGRQIDSWKQADRRHEIRRCLEKACATAKALEEFVKSKSRQSLRETPFEEKVYSGLARKAGYYSRYWFEHKSYFEDRGGGNWLSLDMKDEGALKIVQDAYKILGLNLPWVESKQTKRLEVLDKLYWDFEMEMWMEYDLRISSFSITNDNSNQCEGWTANCDCFEKDARIKDPFVVFAEIVLLYSELTWNGIISTDHSTNILNRCRDWAAKKLARRIREPRTTKMNYAEMLKFTLETFIRFENNISGECERYVTRQHGVETPFFRWADAVLNSNDYLNEWQWNDIEALRAFVELVLSDFVYLLQYANKVKDRERWYLKKLLKRKGEIPLPWDVKDDFFKCATKLGCASHETKIPQDPPEEKKSRNVNLMVELTPRSVVRLIAWIRLWRGDLKEQNQIEHALGVKSNILCNLKKEDNQVSLQDREVLIQRVADMLGVTYSEVLDETSTTSASGISRYSISDREFDTDESELCLEEFVRALRNTSRGVRKYGHEKDMALYEKGLDLYYANLRLCGSASKRSTSKLYEEWKKAKYSSKEIMSEIKDMMRKGKRFYDMQDVDKWFTRTLFSGVGDAVNLLKLGLVGVEFLAINPYRKLGHESIRDVVVRCWKQLCEAKPDWDGAKVLSDKIKDLDV